ncbi:MAG: O-antigen ligase family protein, partial [Bdellovibrionota bacterium]
GAQRLVIEEKGDQKLEVVVADPGPSQFRFETAHQEGLEYLHVAFGGAIYFDLAPTPVGPRILVNYGLHLPDQAERWHLPIDDRLFSCRGYIWSRTLPLVAEAPWIGNGPGAFAVDFPQYDYQGRLGVCIGMGGIIDQPHNLFLQWVHAFGLPSLALFFLLVGYAIKQGRKESPELVAAIIAFLICGIFISGSVQSSPIFWILLGALLARANPDRARPTSS